MGENDKKEMTLQELVDLMSKTTSPVIKPYFGELSSGGTAFSEQSLKDVIAEMEKIMKEPGVITTGLDLYDQPPMAPAKIGSVAALNNVYGKPQVGSRHPNLKVETESVEGHAMTAQVYAPILQTRDEMVASLRQIPHVEQVDIVYDMAPDLAIVITLKEWKHTDYFMKTFQAYLGGVIMEDYTELDWTVKVKGVKKLGNDVPREAGQSKGHISQQTGTAHRDIRDHRIIEKYGYGIINTGAIARTGPLSTD